MVDDWRETTLDQLGRIVTGKTPPSSCAECFGGDIPFVTPTDFDGRRTIRNTLRCLSAIGVQSVAGARIPANSVMVSCIGSDMGKAAVAGRDCVTNQQINSIVVEAKNDPLFVYYNLSVRKAEIRAAASGSAQPILNKSAFGRFTITLPPLSDQRAIAHILGTLDDKIDLNRRMNATLEAMARALYKSWFVDFEPVRAKAEGRDTGLPPEIAALFPDSFEESELGEVPKGWRISTIGQICEFAYGKALKAGDRRPGTVPVYGSNGQVGWHDEALVNGPGIIVGRKGNPGIVTWSQIDFFPIDTTFYIVPRDGMSNMNYLFHMLSAQNLDSLGADSAVPGLNRNLAYMTNVVLPSTRLLNLYESMVKPLSEKCHPLQLNARNLAEHRDALLPQLMTGELDITYLAKSLGEG